MQVASAFGKSSIGNVSSDPRRGVERFVWEHVVWRESATAEGHVVATKLHDLIKAFWARCVSAAE